MVWDSKGLDLDWSIAHREANNQWTAVAAQGTDLQDISPCPSNRSHRPHTSAMIERWAETHRRFHKSIHEFLLTRPTSAA